MISETIDGEVVAIHLGTGVYYSLRDTGAEVWGLLEKGATRAEIVGWLAGAYDAAPNELDAAVGRFIDTLAADELLEASDDDRLSSELPAVERGARPAFTAPTIETFTDMRHVIGMDPIHDVDTTRGWPHPAP